MKRAIIYIIVFSFLLFSCRNESNTESAVKAVSIKTARVEKRNLSIPVQSIGILSSKTQSKLGFLSGGVIDMILVDEGDIVKEGDVLASLKMTAVNSTLQQAEIAYDKSKRDFHRAENLYIDSVATLEQYQNARSALDLADANLKMARFRKQYSAITAPCDGKILKKLLEVNEIVAQGYPVFVFASTDADWVLRVNVSDRDFVKLALNDSAMVSFDAYPGEEFPALVTELANASNLNTGTCEIELQLIQEPEKLISGLIGRADIYPASEERLLIPADAILEGDRMHAQVYVLRSGIPEKRNIQMLGIIGNDILVKEGLAEGEIVITQGQAYIRPGVKVETKEYY